MILTFLIVLGTVLANINAKPETVVTVSTDQQQESTLSATPEHLQAKDELNEIEDYPKVIDVNGTIEEVEQILASNPDLPRLSRNEILSILDNITSQDHNLSETEDEPPKEISTTESTGNQTVPSANRLQTENDKTQEEYMRAMRALMLVLPFNAKNLTYTEIKELYTKAPITRLVGERPGDVVHTTTTAATTTRKPLISVVTTEHITTTATSTTEEQTKQFLNHHESYHQPFDVQPILTSPNHVFVQETTPITTTEQTTTTRRYKHRPNYPHRRRRPTTSSTTEQVTTTTTRPTTKTTQENKQFFTTQTHTPTSEQYLDQFPYQHYQTRVPDISKEKPTTQAYNPTKHVTTIYPEKTINYKTTEHYHKLSSVQTPITTVYPQHSNVKDSTPTSYVEPIKQNDQLFHSIESQTQNNNVFQLHRKRTKPARSTTVTEPTTTTEISEISLDLPHEMKDVLGNFEVDGHLSKVHASMNNKPEITPSIFITPTTEGPKILTGSNPEFTKYSSQYSASEIVYDRVTTTEKPVMRDDVKELLASIGLFPVKGAEATHTTTTTTTTSKPTTTSTETPDIEAAAESFSPEMKDLLISFGLLPSANDIQHPPEQDEQKESIPLNYDQQVASPVIDPSSYLNFKPLPVTAEENTKDDDDWNSDMKQFLASFGLMPSASARATSEGARFSDEAPTHRQQKAINIGNEPTTNSTESSVDLETAATTQMKKEKVPHINMDMLNDEMKEVLENLGFFTSQESFDTEIKRKTNNAEGHIFNPSAHLASLNPTEEEAERLSKLLDTIKRLMKENATISQEEIEALNASISFILPPVPVGNSTELSEITEDNTNLPPLFIPKKQNNKSTPLDKIKNAPDPLSLEELMSLMEDHKNEVKRQQPNNETSTAVTTTTEESTPDPGPSLTDLADSFGGGETASADADVDAALPPKKPNGLYFLLDWNTFLQVEGEKRTINLQFNPKLGDSKAFQPVSVP